MHMVVPFAGPGSGTLNRRTDPLSNTVTATPVLAGGRVSGGCVAAGPATSLRSQLHSLLAGASPAAHNEGVQTVGSGRRKRGSVVGVGSAAVAEPLSGRPLGGPRHVSEVAHNEVSTRPQQQQQVHKQLLQQQQQQQQQTRTPRVQVVCITSSDSEGERGKRGGKQRVGEEAEAMLEALAPASGGRHIAIGYTPNAVGQGRQLLKGPSSSNLQLQPQTHLPTQLQPEVRAQNYERGHHGKEAAAMGGQGGDAGVSRLWWQLLPDFVPVEALAGGTDPRSGNNVCGW
jgi:hypothetical protein